MVDDQAVTGGDETGDRRSSIFELLTPILGWAIGLLIMAWPTFSTGFQRIQGGLGDSRLVNFTLEHSYRWLSGMPLAEDLWSPPIFFPVRNVATYTDFMLGVAPFYWPWRWLGFHPHTAFQLWMLACWSLNFLCFYLLLRRGFRISAIGATAGAYLFAFGSPRYMSMAHQQLTPQFWLVLSLAGLIMLFRLPTRPSRVRGWIACSVLWGGLAAQLWTAVYPFAFFALALASAVAVAAALPKMRAGVFTAVKRHAAPFIIIGIVTLALAAPIATRYRAAAETLGMHKQEQVHLPLPLSWFLPGNSNRVYGSIQKSWDLAEYSGFSQTNGVGVGTLFLCIAGLWLGRRRPEVQMFIAGLGALVLLTMPLPGGWSPWWVVRDLVPGYSALRVIARVGLMVLYPAALGLAITTEYFTSRRRWIIALALALVVVGEQPHRRPSFDKSAAIDRAEKIAVQVPASADAFLLVISGPSWDKYVHDDAEWAALSAGIPTVNGRYGHFPPAYPFRTPWIDGHDGAAEIDSNLKAWIRESDGGAEAAVIKIAPRSP